MSGDMILDLGTNIKGESKDKAYLAKIDILGWNWALHQPASAHTGGGAGVGKVQISDISINKLCDASTANLMLYLAKGKHFDEGKIVCRKAGGDKLEYLVIIMKNFACFAFPINPLVL